MEVPHEKESLPWLPQGRDSKYRYNMSMSKFVPGGAPQSAYVMGSCNVFNTNLKFVLYIAEIMFAVVLVGTPRTRPSRTILNKVTSTPLLGVRMKGNPSTTS